MSQAKSAAKTTNIPTANGSWPATKIKKSIALAKKVVAREKAITLSMKRPTSIVKPNKASGKQLALLAEQPNAYGGDLLKSRKGRSGPRTLATRKSMHLVLRSTQATGELSFARKENRTRIIHIFNKFADKYGVRLLSVAYAGNHIHAQIQLTKRHLYFPFIRATTAAIAMAITGVSRWRRGQLKTGKKFWDYRPFTRVISSFREYLNLRDYIHINRLEGWGYARNEARFLIAQKRLFRHIPS